MNLTHDELMQEHWKLVHMQWEHYMAHDFLTWQWWLLLIVTFVPWVWWAVTRDRRSQYRLLYGAMIVGLMSLVFDIIGTQYGLWRYGVKLIPSLPPLIPYDLTVMPVEYLLIQQVAKTEKRFYWYAAMMAMFNAFVGENFLKWINVYKPLDWQLIYSLPIYFAIFVLASKAASAKMGWDRFYENEQR